MNWLTNFVRPKLKKKGCQREVPDNLWQTCPSCSQMIFHRELTENLHVCPHCDHHLRITVSERLRLLLGESYEELSLPEVPADPLRFRDLKRYSDRLRDAQGKTGRQDALVVAVGSLHGMKVTVAAFDFQFMGGSMGTAVGEGVVTAAEYAVAHKTPLVLIPASGGARMQEGILSLMQMARTTVAVQQVKEAGLPYVVLLTDPTTGGVSASLAMLGDLTLAEPGAVIGFAGQRVIEQTIRETLPPGFQRAEYLRDHGMVDQVVHRRDLRQTLGRLLDLLTNAWPLIPSLTHQDETSAATPLVAATTAAEETDAAFAGDAETPTPEAAGETSDEAGPSPAEETVADETDAPVAEDEPEKRS